MNLKKLGTMAAAVAALSLVAGGFTATAANAAAAPQFYLLDGGDGHLIADDTVLPRAAAPRGSVPVARRGDRVMGRAVRSPTRPFALSRQRRERADRTRGDLQPLGSETVELAAASATTRSA